MVSEQSISVRTKQPITQLVGLPFVSCVIRKCASVFVISQWGGRVCKSFLPTTLQFYWPSVQRPGTHLMKTKGYCGRWLFELVVLSYSLTFIKTSAWAPCPGILVCLHQAGLGHCWISKLPGTSHVQPDLSIMGSDVGRLGGDCRVSLITLKPRGHRANFTKNQRICEIVFNHQAYSKGVCCI